MELATAGCNGLAASKRPAAAAAVVWRLTLDRPRQWIDAAFQILAADEVERAETICFRAGSRPLRGLSRQLARIAVIHGYIVKIGRL